MKNADEPAFARPIGEYKEAGDGKKGHCMR